MNANTKRLEREAADRFEAMLNRGEPISEETGQSMALHSIAISLKRLADAAEAKLDKEITK